MQALGPEELAFAITSADLEPCQLSRGPVMSRLARVMCPQVCLDITELGPAILFKGVMPTAAYTLVFVTKCPGMGKSFNFSMDHTDGYMGFFPPLGELDACTPEGYCNSTLTVPVEVFHAALERLFPEIPDEILKRGAGMRIGPVEQERLKILLAAVRECVEDPTMPLSGVLARGELERLLLDAFVGGLRGGLAGKLRSPKQRVEGRLKRLRQARDFIRISAGGPIFLEDLSGALGMSQRGVEVLFQDSLGIGPAAFIRHQRLHGVRRALLEAQPESGVVKELALDWGFWHMGHFSRNYRMLFGESPSATLGRGLHR